MGKLSSYPQITEVASDDKVPLIRGGTNGWATVDDLADAVSDSLNLPSIGWESGALPAVVSASNNGQRSYDLIFADTVASLLSYGMKLRIIRTISSPTKCTSLNGSNHYYSKSSPAGMTFTDDCAIGVWVKFTSYTAGVIASRFNGTSGWVLTLNANGTVDFFGFNGGGGNYSGVNSYQSIPLNKWVHIAVQLDMSSFTATPTTSYVMIDGVDVPAFVSRSGTNPTALVQAGNFEVGSKNGGSTYFTGKIAQLAIFSAKVTQATMKTYYSQGLSGSETNLISGYSFNNSFADLNATNANNLTANNGVVATDSDSPFSVDGDNTPTGQYDYAVVTKVNGSTVTCQVAEGCTIPTSGGITSVDLSTSHVPYKFPSVKDRWQVIYQRNTTIQQSSPGSTTWYNVGSPVLSFPIGRWKRRWQSPIAGPRSTGGATGTYRATLSTANNTVSDISCSATTRMDGATGSNNDLRTSLFRECPSVNLASVTPYYLNYLVDGSNTTIDVHGAESPVMIIGELDF